MGWERVFIIAFPIALEDPDLVRTFEYLIALKWEVEFRHAETFFAES